MDFVRKLVKNILNKFNVPKDVRFFVFFIFWVWINEASRSKPWAAIGRQIWYVGLMKRSHLLQAYGQTSISAVSECDVRCRFSECLSITFKNNCCLQQLMCPVRSATPAGFFYPMVITGFTSHSEPVNWIFFIVVNACSVKGSCMCKHAEPTGPEQKGKYFTSSKISLHTHIQFNDDRSCEKNEGFMISIIDY